jgi:8-oxo-dGTP diphosphatase
MKKKFSYAHPHPAVASDIAVFGAPAISLAAPAGAKPGPLNILLVYGSAPPPFADCWALPGGFVRPEETVEKGATRTLFAKTGVDRLRLLQFGIYSSPDRDPRERVISIAYLACVNQDSTVLKAGEDLERAGWHDVSNLPRLAFDHAEIIADAILALRENVSALWRPRTIGALAAKAAEPALPHLLGSSFTLSELQGAAELVLGEEIDKRNFRKQVLEAGWVVETSGQLRGRHRPAQLYRLDDNPS